MRGNKPFSPNCPNNRLARSNDLGCGRVGGSLDRRGARHRQTGNVYRVTPPSHSPRLACPQVALASTTHVQLLQSRNFLK